MTAARSADTSGLIRVLDVVPMTIRATFGQYVLVWDNANPESDIYKNAALVAGNQSLPGITGANNYCRNRSYMILCCNEKGPYVGLLQQLRLF